ncbi:MAG: manganese-dependent inorganic pyrophosphatase [Candidatus Aenigmatarchaeota archaeon]
MIYVVGHKAPDTDSVCSAIVYAGLKGFKPVVAGEINEETKYVLDYFKVPIPEKIENASGKTLVLVDHNEPSQRVDGAEKIIAIIDHHKMNFNYPEPIFVHVEPVGSTATIIAKMFLEEIKKDETYSGLLLAAILSDTVVFKSPTTTEDDRKIAEELAKVAKIPDMIKFGIEIKKVKTNIKNREIPDIILEDFKDYEFFGKKVGIGQVEVVDLEEVEERKGEILDFLKKLKEDRGYEIVLFMATDIMKEGTELYFVGNHIIVEKAFGFKLEGNSIWLPGVMSRKKQVVPGIEKACSENY